MAIGVLVTGCSNSHGSGASGPTTTLIQADHWDPPTPVGPPSTADFCTLLVADYEHLGSLAIAPKVKVRQQIVADVIAFAPTVIAAAPSQISSAASIYLTGYAKILADLNAVGLNAARLPKGEIGGLLTDPSIQQAGSEVSTFSEQNCHYVIGG